MPLNLDAPQTEDMEIVQPTELTMLKIDNFTVNHTCKSIKINYRKGYVDGETEVYLNEQFRLIIRNEMKENEDGKMEMVADYDTYIMSILDVFGQVKQTLYEKVQEMTGMTGTIN